MKEHVKPAGGSKKPNKPQKKQQGDEKKPFDKKKYRLQKYSNKFKIDQWEERRKKAILRDYYKELDKSQRQAPKKPFNSQNKTGDQEEKKPQKTVSAFHKAKQEYSRKKGEKRKKKEDALRMKSEREDALKKYKEKKMQTYKKLSKKTKKGQPVMKDRLEMLLEKIQQNVS